MNELPQKESDDYCNARKTDGSGYCQNGAGKGTDHPDIGRCYLHGGNTKSQEKGILNELEDAAEDASVALRLKLKHAREKAEAGEYDDIDWAQLDRHARTVLDRTNHGPTETRELENTGDGPLSETVIDFNDVDT